MQFRIQTTTKKRRTGCLFLFCCLLLLFACQVHASAAKTDVILNIPKTCLLDVQIEGSGYLEVSIGSKKTEIKKDTEIRLAKDRDFLVRAVPQSGNIVKSMMLNGIEYVGQQKDNRLSVSGIDRDSTLKVVFQKSENAAAKTDDENKIILWGCGMIFALAVLVKSFHAYKHV